MSIPYNLSNTSKRTPGEITETFYKSIINKVMNNSKILFSQNGLSERAHEKLKETWLKKLDDSNVYGGTYQKHYTILKQIAKSNLDDPIQRNQVENYQLKSIQEGFNENKNYGKLQNIGTKVESIKTEYVKSHVLHRPQPQKPTPMGIPSGAYPPAIILNSGPSLNIISQELNSSTVLQGGGMAVNFEFFPNGSLKFSSNLNFTC